MRALTSSAVRAWLPPVILALAACWPSSAAGQAPGGAAGSTAAGSELVVIGPAEARSSTVSEFVNVIGRTSPKATVRVAGVGAAVFSTGIFVRDRVPLELGANTIRIEAVGPGSETAVRMIEVERQPPPPAESRATGRLMIDVKSIEPRSMLRVAPGEPVEVSFRATPGMIAEARLPAGRWQRLDEAADAGTGQPAGLYLGYLVPAATGDTPPRPVQVRLKAAPRAAVQGRRSVTAESAGAVGLWAAERVRLVVVAGEGADLTWGLHEVRLGGPNLAELAGGTVLRITGQRGDFYRVRLAPDTEGWVRIASVTPAPPAMPIPKLVFTSLSVSGEAVADTVVIPCTAPVPYAARSTGEADGRAGLDVDFYGAHNAATWITRRATATVVREVSVEQPAVDRIRVRIALHDRRLWGYKVERAQGSVRITIRRPPVPAASPVWPLQGLIIALEPGHGGAANVGARGSPEPPRRTSTG